MASVKVDTQEGGTRIVPTASEASAGVSTKDLFLPHTGVFGPVVIDLTEDNDVVVDTEPGAFLLNVSPEDSKILCYGTPQVERAVIPLATAKSAEKTSGDGSQSLRGGPPVAAPCVVQIRAAVDGPGTGSNLGWESFGRRQGSRYSKCCVCGKWRIIPTEEQYQAIGERILEQPWNCQNAQAWRKDVSCNDPSDLSEDEPSLVWAVDKHGIPYPPQGFHRKVVIRGELCSRFADVYYKTPCGKRLRSMVDVRKFLDNQPLYVSKGVNLSQFSFTPPKRHPGSNKRSGTTFAAGSEKTKNPCLSRCQESELPGQSSLACFPRPLGIMRPVSEVSELPMPNLSPPTSTLVKEKRSKWDTITAHSPR